jgi:hypothetical protein
MHHLNWRVEAINSFGREDHEHTVHYTAVMSIDAKSASKIQDILLDAITNCDPQIREAKDEEVHALTVDFFKIS